MTSLSSFDGSMECCPPSISSEVREDFSNRVLWAIVLQNVVIVCGLIVVTLCFISPPPWGLPMPIPVSFLAAISIGASAGAWANLVTYRKRLCIVFSTSVAVSISTVCLCYTIPSEVHPGHARISLVGTSPYVQFLFTWVMFFICHFVTALFSEYTTSVFAFLIKANHWLGHRALDSLKGN